jgi:hypothetical protein
MLIGLSILIRKYQVTPTATETVLAELTAAGLGHNFVFYAVQMITTILLALAANTSFGGLPVLASLLATDNFLPHLFFLRADRQVHRYGIGVLAVAAALLLIVSRGDTQALVPLFAIGVFVGFTLSQAGMVRHWHQRRGPGWGRRAAINGVGAVFTLVALAIELGTKFLEGAWLVVIVVPLLVLLFRRIGSAYSQIGSALALGETPAPPRRLPALVVVPVARMSKLTEAGISAALSLGDEVRAVTVCYHDEDDEEADATFRAEWEAWHPDVPLISLPTRHRALGPPIVEYLRALEHDEIDDQVVVLIPEVQPSSPLRRVLYNQRGAVLDRAIRRGTDNVVICRLRFRLKLLLNQPAGDPGGPRPAPGGDAHDPR